MSFDFDEKKLKELASMGGECLSNWQGHTKSVWALGVLSNGWVVSGSFDKTIKCWRINNKGNGECLATWKGHAESVNALAVLSNGWVVSGSDDSTIKCWRVDEKGNGECLATWKGHSSHVATLAVLSNGWVVSGSDDSTIKCWRVDEKGEAQCLTTWQGHTKSVRALAVLSNGWVVSGSGDSTIKCWRVDEKGGAQCLATWEGYRSNVAALAVLSNGWVVSGSGDNTIKCWRVDEKGGAQCLATWKGHRSNVTALAVLSNGWVMSGSGDNTIKCWRVDEKGGAQCLATWEGTGNVWALAVLSNGWVVSGGVDDTIKCWRGDGLRLLFCPGLAPESRLSMTFDKVLEIIGILLTSPVPSVFPLQAYPSAFLGDNWQRLKGLILDKTSAKPEGALRVIDFSYNQLQDRHLSELIDLVNHLPSLQILILDFNRLTKYGLQNLLKGLRRHPALKRLSLRGNRVDEVDKASFEMNIMNLLLEVDGSSISRVDISLNLMADWVATDKSRYLALLALLVSLNQPLCKATQVELVGFKRNKEGQWSLSFTEKGNVALQEAPLSNQHYNQLRAFQTARSGQFLEPNEVSQELLSAQLKLALQDNPALADINLKEKPFAEQKAIAKQLVESHPDMPLKYVLSHHPIFRCERTSKDMVLPSLLRPGFSVTKDRWIVYLMAGKTVDPRKQHALLAWEGLHGHGQRVFRRAHLTVNDTASSGFKLAAIKKIQISWKMWEKMPELVDYPNWFEGIPARYYVAAFYGTRQQVKALAKEVNHEITNGLPIGSRYHSLPLSSGSRLSTQDEEALSQNCVSWITQKINQFLALPQEERLSGQVPGGVASYYANIGHEEALTRFAKRINVSGASLLALPEGAALGVEQEADAAAQESRNCVLM
jgi:hypothetical protein